MHKACQWLIMTVAVLLASATAMAQDATFDFRGTINAQSPLTDGCVTVRADQISAYADGANIYRYDIYNDWGITLTSTGARIVKIEFTTTGMASAMTTDGVGTYTAVTSTSAIWTGHASSVRLHAMVDIDAYVTHALVWLEEDQPDSPLTYTVRFDGDVPEGCSATLAGQTFSADGTLDIACNFKADDLQTTTTADYYADVTYNAASRTYTVAFRHWITYHVSVNHFMGALEYNGYYGDGATFRAKTVIAERDFAAYDLDGYNETIRVTRTSDYDYTVAVTYAESAPITYNVAFNTVPQGAYAWIEGIKFSDNATFQSVYELTSSDIREVYCPEGYYDNSYYSAADRTFYINYYECDKYYVEVIGTDDPEAGLVYNFNDYHDGDVIYANYTLYPDFMHPVEIPGYSVALTIDDHTCTVTYTEVPVQGVPWQADLAEIFQDCTIVDHNGDGMTWRKNGDEILYPYNGAQSADDYVILTPVRLEGGKTYTVALDTHQAYSYPERIEVLYGRRGNVEALTHTAIEPTNVTWEQYRKITAEVTIDDSGVYFFALHAISPRDLYYLYAKTFSIKDYNGPVERENVMDVASTFFATGEVTEIRANLTFVTTVNTQGAHCDDPLVPEGVTLLDAEGRSYPISTFMWWDDDCQVSINLPAPITTVGTYTLTIPEGVIPGVGHTANRRIVFEWNVVDPIVGHLAMPADGYTTLCTPYDYTLPMGYRAYAIGEDHAGVPTLIDAEGLLILTELTGGVPAGTPVVIAGPEASDVPLQRTFYTPSAPQVNFLMGNSLDEEQTFNARTIADAYPGDADEYAEHPFGPSLLYQLTVENRLAGFFRNDADDRLYTCPAHKACLVVPTDVAVSHQRLYFPGQSELTAIDAHTTAAPAVDVPVYNLRGQRVSAHAPATPGVSIKDGKKSVSISTPARQ